MLKVTANFARDASKQADTCTAQVFIHAYKSLIIKDQLNFDDEDHFKNMDKKSLSLGCGCELCRVRHAYTMAKLERHRAYKRATDDDYVYHSYGVSCASEDFDRVDELNEQMASLFYEKELIKERLGYDKSKASTNVPLSTKVHRGNISDIRIRGILIAKQSKLHEKL
jgi:hypothetical protein